jgi:2-keto-myo-inositol isomerase
MPDFSYCLNSSTIKPAPILKKIEIAGKVGYTAIELWHDDIDAHLASGGKLADIKKALADHRLAVPTTIFLKGWYDTTGEEHTKALDECKRRMAQAVEVGALHCIGGPPPKKSDRELGARNYRELLDIGISMGVRPSMEFLGFVEDIKTIEDALDIMTHSGHPQATTILDPFHIFRGGGSPESILKLKPEQIAICHFNDTPTSPPREVQHDKDRVMPGDGHLPLKHELNLLRQIGYNRWLSLELFNEALWAKDPLEVARVGLEKMRAIAE